MVSNSVSCVGHILTKRGSRAALREKMSPRATIGGKNAFIQQKTVVLAIILVMSRAAQTHLAGQMRPAGRVFETPGLDYVD